jgi:hypothetical protein
MRENMAIDMYVGMMFEHVKGLVKLGSNIVGVVCHGDHEVVRFINPMTMHGTLDFWVNDLEARLSSALSSTVKKCLQQRPKVMSIAKRWIKRTTAIPTNMTATKQKRDRMTAVIGAFGRERSSSDTSAADGGDHQRIRNVSFSTADIVNMFVKSSKDIKESHMPEETKDNIEEDGKEEIKEETEEDVKEDGDEDTKEGPSPISSESKKHNSDDGAAIWLIDNYKSTPIQSALVAAEIDWAENIESAIRHASSNPFKLRDSLNDIIDRLNIVIATHVIAKKVRM